MPGMFDQAKALLKARKAQQELKKTEIEASGGEGKVLLVFTGDLKLKSITLDESLLAPERKAELERLLKDTFTQGMQETQQVAADKTRGVMRDLGMNIPGM
ncbi:YbaB/EbfC family nucleoid-associated protein [Candidatus Berkelbacteria bacterium]|nr:YbaB/EbfC family nucleoid-associated protein [Candidatus Berkelbacteria bacterium]